MTLIYYIAIQLAFLTLFDLALNPPFLGGKMIVFDDYFFMER